LEFGAWTGGNKGRSAWIGRWRARAGEAEAVRGKRASAGEAKAARASEIAGEAGRRMKIIRFSPVVFP